MTLPLEQIETSVIEELVVLKRDREVLAERLARMMEEKDKVSGPVFQRVHGDYQARLAALEKGAAPKKDQARREYAKLRTLLDQVRSLHEAALQDQEELEFRHRLGEFEAGEFDQKSAEVAERIETHERELSEVTAVRERFVAAFDSEDELTQPPAVERTPKPLPRSESYAVSTPPPALESAPVGSGTTVDHQLADTAAPPPPAVPGAETLVAPTGDTGVRPVPLAPTAPAAPSAPPAPEPQPLGGTVLLKDIAPPPAKAAEGGGLGMTMIVSSARLVPLGGGVGTATVAEYRVQPFTSIGRTRQNQVQLDEPSVSRKHAQIALSEGSYLLTDLHSENGTFVNGEKITEQRLKDGDRLQFGSVRFTFHTS